MVFVASALSWLETQGIALVVLDGFGGNAAALVVLGGEAIEAWFARADVVGAGDKVVVFSDCTALPLGLARHGVQSISHESDVVKRIDSALYVNVADGAKSEIVGSRVESSLDRDVVIERLEVASGRGQCP